MRRFRRKYYDLFSTVYDRFVAMHSSDGQGLVRRYLAEKTGLGPGERVLDICTGTGAVLSPLSEKVGPRGMAVGIDFSQGMLRKAKERSGGRPPAFLVLGDAGRLPFKEGIFHVVTCAHAFYELRGRAQDRCLREVRRVLRPGGCFLMLEHDVPKRRVPRLLFYLRLLSMGRERAIAILRHEGEILSRYFPRVSRLRTPTGRSKIMRCSEGRPGSR